MPTFDEILRDSTTYPDDRRLTLADGVEVSLKDLRGGFLRQQDYTQKTMKLSQERQDWERERIANESALEQAKTELSQMAERLVARQHPSTVDEAEEALQRDPVAKKLLDKIDRLEKSTTAANERSEKIEQELKARREQEIVRFHQARLTEIKKFDPSLDVETLTAFAKQRGIPDLGVAYQVMTEADRWAKREAEVRDEERKKAEEAAKLVAANPVLPTRRFTPPTLNETQPKTFDEAADAASRDPEILAILNGTA